MARCSWSFMSSNRRERLNEIPISCRTVGFEFTFVRMQSFAAGTIRDLRDHAHQTLAHRAGKKRSQPTASFHGKHRTWEEGIFPLLCRVPRVGWAEHGRTVCGSNGAASSIIEIIYRAVLCGWSIEVGSGERAFSVRNAKFERNFVRRRNVVYRRVHQEFARGRKFGRASNVFRRRYSRGNNQQEVRAASAHGR